MLRLPIVLRYSMAYYVDGLVGLEKGRQCLPLFFESIGFHLNDSIRTLILHWVQFRHIFVGGKFVL